MRCDRCCQSNDELQLGIFDETEENPVENMV